MAETVFIFGAGASREAGAPPMADFLESAFDLRRSGDIESDDAEAFDLVRRGRDALQSAQSKARIDIDNLEEVFDAFEMAAWVGRLGDMEPGDVQALPGAMRTVITVTLERLIKLPLHPNSRRMAPHPVHDAFAKLVQSLRRQGQSAPTVISLNHDCSLDYALYHDGISFSYHPGEGSAAAGVRLLKLHGSLNWAHCTSPGCSHVQARTMEEHFRGTTVAPARRLAVCSWRTRRCAT